MARFDVFNGDADGICALRQLRLAEPADSEIVTGLKHDIALLARVPARAGDQVTVLDLSLRRNFAALVAMLERGVHVRYFDHHDAGEVPRHRLLDATLDASGLACTSELVDIAVGGRFRAWAVVGAFGDGLVESAQALARKMALDPEQALRLRALGEAMNYNAYGDSEADVLVPPERLYRLAAAYRDPFAFLEGEPLLDRLARERDADLERAAAVPAAWSTASAQLRVLPGAAWSRRVMGTFAHRLAAEDPRRVHAVAVPRAHSGYRVSVRTPAGRSLRADAFCRRFPQGGGRATAAGIEDLGAEGLDGFLAAFSAAYAGGGGA